MYFHPCTWNSIGNLSFFVKTHQGFHSHEQTSLTKDLLGCPGSPTWLCPPRERQILKRRIPNNRRDEWCLQDSDSFHCLPEESCFPAVRTRQKFCWNIHWFELVKRRKRIIILWRIFFKCGFFDSACLEGTVSPLFAAFSSWFQDLGCFQSGATH